eukprot:g74184.t1
MLLYMIDMWNPFAEKNYKIVKIPKFDRDRLHGDWICGRCETENPAASDVCKSCFFMLPFNNLPAPEK